MEPLEFPGVLQSLGPIRDFVHSTAAAAGLDKTATYRLTLAVDEIASNIVIHGYDEAGLKGEIRAWSELDEHTLKIHLEDTGASYDVSLYEKPQDLSRPFAERTEGGLGVYLAIQGVDDFSYVTEGGRNHHTFVLNLESFAGPGQ